MQYTVLLRRRPMGHYTAVAPAAPGCQVEGRTRDEALRHLKVALEGWLTETEITTIEVAAPKSGNGREQNPWLATAGLFADDSTLEPMLHGIYALRDAEVQGN